MIRDLASRITPQHEENGALKRTLASEARFYADVLIQKMTQLNICYRYPRTQKDVLQSGIQRVKFRRAVTTPEAIYLELDTLRLPRGVSLASINDERILDDLSVACRRPVKFRSGVQAGAWLIVGRDSGVWGIQSRLQFAEIMDRYPDKSRKLLVVPLGVGENHLLKFDSIDEFPHALIGGATKAGKSTFMHAWICALMLKNAPEALRMVLIDLKGGVEFTRYQKAPHLLEGGFIKDKTDVIPMLTTLQKTLEERLAMFEQAGGIQNVAAWNYRHHAKPLYRIVVFIDELASLMLEPDLKKDAERLLSDIGARGRAPGIHLVVGTQRPEVSVVSGRIKGNLDARFAFRVPDNQSSMVILDDGSAARFPEDTPRGRFIYKFGNDRRELQGPLITPAQIDTIVRSLNDSPDAQAEAAHVPPEALFEIALKQLNGAFAVNTIYKIMAGQASLNFIKRIAQDYEGQIIEINSELYELRPAEPGKSRTLVAVGSTMEENAGAPEGVEGDTGQDTTEAVTAEDVFRLVVYNLEGDFSLRQVYEAFEGAVSKKQIEEWGKEYEGQEIEIDGVLYVLEPGAGSRSRRLREVNPCVQSVKEE